MADSHFTIDEVHVRGGVRGSRVVIGGVLESDLEWLMRASLKGSRIYIVVEGGADAVVGSG